MSPLKMGRENPKVDSSSRSFADMVVMLIWAIKTKLTLYLGVLKTYRLTFEEVQPMHAQFIKENANNVWTISSKTLREFVEHFGPGTEQLDIYSEDGRVSFTSYTEKIVSGNGESGYWLILIKY